MIEPKPSTRWGARFQLPLILISALAGASLGGCSSCNKDDGPDSAQTQENEPPPPPVVEPPASMTGRGSFGGGAATMQRFRNGLPGILARVMIPEGPAAILERIVPLPPAVTERLPASGDVHLVSIDHDGASGVVMAMRADVTANNPFGADVQLQDAPFGRILVLNTPQPADGGEPGVAALIDRTLVVGPNQQVLEIAAPYAAWLVDQGEAPTGIFVTVPESVIQDKIRPSLTEIANTTTQTWEAEAEAERASHEGDPEVGDPEQAIEAGQNAINRFLAYLPDLGDITLHLRPADGRILLEAKANITAGSPLATTIAGRPTVELAQLGRVGRGAGISMLTRSSLEDGNDALNQLFEIAGDRMDEASQETARNAYNALLQSSDGSSLMTVGLHNGGFTVAMGSRGSSTTPNTDAIVGFFETDYWRNLRDSAPDVPSDAPSALRDCNTPRRFAFAAASETRKVMTLCRDSWQVALSTQDTTWASALYDPPEDEGDDAAGAPDVWLLQSLAAAEPGEDAIGSDPDVQRILTDLSQPGREFLFGATLRPQNVALALTAVQRGIRPPAEVQTYRTPTIISASRAQDESGPRIEAHLQVTNQALEEWMALLRPLLMSAAGGL